MIRHLRAPLAIATALALGGATARADIIDYTYSFATDTESRGLPGDPGNVVIELDLTSILGILPEFEIIGLGWDVDLFANAPSALSEMGAFINGGAIGFAAGVIAGPGNPTNSSLPVFLFSSAGGDSVPVIDGMLRIELAEGTDDDGVDPDGLWLAGSTVTFRLDVTPAASAVPEPGSLALAASGAIGLALIARARRRR